MEGQLEKSARRKNVRPEPWLGFVNPGFGLDWPTAFRPGSNIDHYCHLTSVPTYFTPIPTILPRSLNLLKAGQSPDIPCLIAPSPSQKSSPQTPCRLLPTSPYDTNPHK
ncbi:hypothetical protein K443DRAFT_677463 [Laccaria amethystina LaAM-08-1]|uniref:Uncharacterized protein n=1 Tax=Laccaria amethystina LaAM-08-1 TaxID=1095629 RepID=A0A0C9XY54_9AGAR|nr:hypothetical protein K443DRAFT_677463 [Laccaria amethystina LaAM-08-1]